jgi:hypothetical protein
VSLIRVAGDRSRHLFFPNFSIFRFHRADYLVKTDQMVNKKFDFLQEITILFGSVVNKVR